MKFPKYIACIASYYEGEEDNVVMHSLVISRTKNDSIIVCNYYKLDDIDDDDALTEIDEIVREFDKTEIGVVYSDNPVPLDGMNMKMITREEYRNIIKMKKDNG